MSDGSGPVLFGVRAKRRKHTRDDNLRTSALVLEKRKSWKIFNRRGRRGSQRNFRSGRLEEIQPQRTRRCVEVKRKSAQ